VRERYARLSCELKRNRFLEEYSTLLLRNLPVGRAVP
jgi:hypothetical protein